MRVDFLCSFYYTSKLRDHLTIYIHCRVHKAMDDKDQQAEDTLLRIILKMKKTWKISKKWEIYVLVVRGSQKVDFLWIRVNIYNSASGWPHGTQHCFRIHQDMGQHIFDWNKIWPYHNLCSLCIRVCMTCMGHHNIQVRRRKSLRHFFLYREHLRRTAMDHRGLQSRGVYILPIPMKIISEWSKFFWKMAYMGLEYIDKRDLLYIETDNGKFLCDKSQNTLHLSRIIQGMDLDISYFCKQDSMDSLNLEYNLVCSTVGFQYSSGGMNKQLGHWLHGIDHLIHKEKADKDLCYLPQ